MPVTRRNPFSVSAPMQREKSMVKQRAIPSQKPMLDKRATRNKKPIVSKRNF